jgi:hypothetical protein
MIEALKQSTEDRHLVALAKKYCYGIKGDLAQRERRKSGKATDTGRSTTAGTVPAATQPVVDLTGRPANGHGQSNSTQPAAMNDIEMYSALSSYLSERK